MSFDDVDEARMTIESNLPDQRVMVLLDDVWSPGIIDAFRFPKVSWL